MCTTRTDAYRDVYSKTQNIGFVVRTQQHGSSKDNHISHPVLFLLFFWHVNSELDRARVAMARGVQGAYVLLRVCVLTDLSTDDRRTEPIDDAAVTAATLFTRPLLVAHVRRH